ncbi:MAG: hypothetical protein RI914_1579, partial [Pseudomonadota bacterium]
ALNKRSGRLSMLGLQAQPRSLIERSGFARHLYPL